MTLFNYLVSIEKKENLHQTISQSKFVSGVILIHVSELRSFIFDSRIKYLLFPQRCELLSTFFDPPAVVQLLLKLKARFLTYRMLISLNVEQSVK